MHNMQKYMHKNSYKTQQKLQPRRKTVGKQRQGIKIRRKQKGCNFSANKLSYKIDLFKTFLFKKAKKKGEEEMPL